MKEQIAQQNIIITVDYDSIKHLKLNEIKAFRVKNGVYKVILKEIV